MDKTQLRNLDNWIFDWSGTLVDDLALVVDATNHVMRFYDKPELDREEFRRRFRLPYTGFYEEMLPGIALAELEDHFREGFANSAAAGTLAPMLPHACEFLDFLKSQQKRIFILSSMDAQAFDSHARDLNVHHHFEAVYAGVLDKRELIGEILKTHAMMPSATVFVGDMEHDIATARHGGVSSIALLTGYQDEKQLLSENPDLLCRDLSELQQRLS